MRYVISLGLLCVFMVVPLVLSGAPERRVERIERIEATVLEILDRVKRIEGRVVGEPTPAPALEDRRALEAYREKYKRDVSPAQWERISPLFDPTAPLPVNPK